MDEPCHTAPRMGFVEKLWRYARAVAPDAAKAPLDPFYARKARRVERLVLTMGYSHAGSSLIGQLLNAHPDVVVSHELYLLQKLRDLRRVPTPSRKGRMTRLIWERDRSFDREWSRRNAGYPYAVQGGWQGKTAHPRLIGDKASPNVVHVLAKHGTRELARLGMPVRFLFTIRNPYDCVASKCLGSRVATRHGDSRPLREYAPTEARRRSVGEEDLRWFLGICQGLSQVLPALGQDGKEVVLPIRYEEFIASAKEKLMEVCAFLGLRRHREWLDACAAFTLRNPHLTRRKVCWTDRQKTAIAEAIATYPWLADYGFDN